ncbi:MAG TPA: Gfo/Idh/MocA family oxidoreductase [Bryobacteraceae bacterium]|nr:Gfo/Idh/MocA family oxidoreductase [Bryobacteraceae bacterium]
MSITRRSLIQAAGVAPLLAQSERPRSANDRIQVGVIGTGARAQELMQALQVLPGVEIVGVVDAYKGRVERAIERTNGRAKAYPDHHALLAQQSIDAVVVGTPDHWHRQMVIDAMAAGKDVYCEKPLTYRSSEGVDIIRAAKERGRILQVGSQGMSSSVQRKAKELIQSGRLGKITIIRAAYNRNTASGAWIYPIPPDASPQTVNWEMFLGSAPKQPYSNERFFRWRCFRDYSGGIATDLFVHLCTTIHYLMDARVPARAVAMGELYRWKDGRDVPDTLNGILEYAEGFVVNLSSTFNNESSAEGSFQILGTEGSISLGDGLTYHAEAVLEDNRWVVDSWSSALEQAYYRDPKVIEKEVPSAWPEKTLPVTEHYRQEGVDSTVTHMGHWLDSIRSRKAYWEDASAGHHAASCAHMINQSAAERRMVEWDSSRDDIKSA